MMMVMSEIEKVLEIEHQRKVGLVMGCCSRCVLRHNRMANQQMEVISFFVVFVRANQTLPPRCPSAQSETAPTWAPTTGATNTDSQ